MNAFASLLLITSLSIPTPMLVFRSGERVAVDGAVRVEDGRVLFRSGGALYSVPAEEVDLDATRNALTPNVPVSTAGGKSRLRVSEAERERLLRELENNHSGIPATPAQLELPAGPSAAERQEASADEWSWRRSARSYEENIRRAQEDLDMLVDRAAALRAHIAGLLSLGYKPRQFSYDTTQLAYMEEQIPRAELEVRRAQRAYDQFRDDARRQGVTPGWLR